MRFIIYTRDELFDGLFAIYGDKAEEYRNIVLNTPAFLLSKNLDEELERHKLLLPDAYLIRFTRWLAINREVKYSGWWHSWDQKEEKVFWRGGFATYHSTGDIEYDKVHLERVFPRLHLVLLSEQYPEFIDANFTSLKKFLRLRNM